LLSGGDARVDLAAAEAMRLDVIARSAAAEAAVAAIRVEQELPWLVRGLLRFTDGKPLPSR
jgi:hypothetical protein